MRQFKISFVYDVGSISGTMLYQMQEVYTEELIKFVGLNPDDYSDKRLIRQGIDTIYYISTATNIKTGVLFMAILKEENNV